MNADTFGEKLRTLRKKRRVSQTEMALDLASDYGLRMSQTTLSALEQQSELPNPNVLSALSDYLNISSNYFATLDTSRAQSALLYIEEIRNGDVNCQPVLDIAKIPRGLRHMRVTEDAYDDEEFFDM